MYWSEKHVLVCTASHCAQKGASDVVGRLRLEIVRRGLDVRILVNTCGTIDLCDIGPNVVIYPDNIIYRGVTVKDLPEIIDNLTGGPTIDRLVLDRDAPDEVTRRAFYAAAVEPDPARPTGEFVALAALHGFDEPWIAEQQRRGFVARKPAANGESIHVTKKARGRYSV
ncbi:MAG: (2Fe-2S) ferredoxin domain-containing protein [Chloroflexia bacterium]|nr:(2Fe-2S) ferredoxin domain-containing protein [Chloroflexia bacterium]